MIENVIKIAKDAGEIIMNYYKQNVSKKEKSDGSYVTTADLEASKFIEDKLAQLFPQDQVISEENLKERIDFTERIWMIDPLDGTKFFIENKPVFSVVISCIENGESILGLIYYPALDKLFYASKGEGCRIEEHGIKKRIIKNGGISLNNCDLVYKPSTLKLEKTKKLVEKLDVKNKQELRPSGFLCSEFLEDKYDIILLGGGNKYELGAFDILIRESGYYFGNIDGSGLNYKQEEIRFACGCIGCSYEILKEIE